ncbi:murein biosynthesis integral membrane protein MurJ [Saccharopolyspora flava]|uniref:Putative peptidoglycan lipid II flippase n=1 Tax=Saccharopolyspora flava TaxID=95161 RepID=A0A1I6T8C4_9PSEU|nr:murein biosynthesis integral membrane protein MurJ [Saccharopolyspora flava]SFS85197.1 putative peptidoglycan lipid II flippase [Saccharopolyspora flava]
MNRQDPRLSGGQPDSPTMPMNRDPRQGRPGGHPRQGWHVAETQPIAAIPAEPGPDQAFEQAQTEVIRPVSPGKPSLLKASGSMAIATLISRITGFFWKLLLAFAVGFGVVNDSFNVSNTLPNSIFELLIGGVLTSVVVPVLVRSQKADADGGQRFVQQMMTLAVVVLGIGTLIAVIAAPLLTWIFVTASDTSNTELVNVLAYLLLPQIFFYGLSALAGAILQSKQIFSPPAWAPVVNNLVVIVTIGVYMLLPGEMSLNPVTMTDAHVLVLGIGVTLGVVSQAAIQIPALRSTGFTFRWRWGWDSRLSEFGGLALWMLAYVAVSQIGLVALSRVAFTGDAGGWSTYNYVWMLLQLPYGVIGFSIMTAILPRMSAAAADEDYAKVIDDLSLGNRLSTVTLMPVSAVMTALGVPLALSLFALRGETGSATTLGVALAISAFGVLPYALTMMQMRTFNALNDARTPTLIMVVMTVAKVLLAVLVAAILPSDQIVFGLTFVNSFTFIVGWLVGEAWLRHRLGPLGSRRFLATAGKSLIASVIGGLAAWGVAVGIDALVPGAAGAGTGWLQLLIGSVIGFAVIFGLMSMLRVAELQPAIGRLTGLLRRR